MVTQRDRPEEPGHRPQLEHRVLGDRSRCGTGCQPAHRLQLRRGEEHHRPGLNGRRVVEQQPHAGRSEQPGPRLLDAHRPAIASSCRRPTRKQYFGFGATSISAFWETPHAGQHQLHLRRRRQRRHRLVERPDLHPARHVGDELHRRSPPRRTFTAAQQADGVRGLHRAGQVPERASRRIRAARRRVPAAAAQAGPQRDAGRLQERQGPAATPASSASTSRTSATC